MAAGPAPIPSTARPGRILPALAALAVLLILAANTPRGILEVFGQPASRAYYNLLVDGFRAGHLSLAADPPAGLALLPDPYDPAANAAYRAADLGWHDASYYHGRFYLYFGAAPAVLLFWPWVALTGHYLSHRWAVLAFCAAGFLIGAALLGAVRRRYFAQVGAGAVAAAVLVLGLCAGLPLLLQRADVWEVPIACGYALTTLSMAAVWLALERPSQAGRWLAAASLAYGLAVAARPSLLFGAVILLVPLWARRKAESPNSAAGQGPSLGSLFASAAVPFALCGLAVALYNQARFGSPLEFGQHFQLAADRQNGIRHFSLGYLWFNIRVYFLAPVRWSGTLPFVGHIFAPPAPAGHAPPEDPFGILANVPVALLAAAAPLCWRGRPPEEASRLRRLAAVPALLFATSAAVLCLFYGTCSRYELEFLAPLLLLTGLGLFGVERALAARPGPRRIWRCAAAALIVFSVGFNQLFALERYAERRCELAGFLVSAGRPGEAVPLYQSALRASPGLAQAHNDLGNAWLHLGDRADALKEYETALRLAPDSAPEEYNLGNLLVQSGQPAEAVDRYEAALRLRPDYAEAHYNLSIALWRLGRNAEAQAQYSEALRLRPDMARGGRP